MDIKQYNIPKSPGSYQFKDQDGKIIYIGKASNLHSRVLSYFRESANHTPAKFSMVKKIEKIEWIETDSEIEALLLESNLVKKHQPIFNVDLKDDKRFLYIKISTEDEIPGVFATRKIDKSGKYFGPFTSAQAVRETLKAIRKIWPFCTERKIGKKICFYAQIGRCTGVCGGKFGLREYKDNIIKPIVLFLDGRKKEIIKKLEKEIGNWKLEIKKLKKGSDEHLEIEKLIFGTEMQIKNIQNVLEHTRVIGVAEKYSADVVELAKVLGLAKAPERIEGYDISNIFGEDAVGSMVVFKGGEPDTNEYRKFKIKFSSEQGDVGMLKEVLGRRFAHSISNFQFQISNQIQNPKSKNLSSIENKADWTLPDLIIIDGGKAQLNVAVRVLKNSSLDIPVLAVSKGEGLRSAQAPDKIFFPGEAKPLELPLASPALHIIKRVRDEAHRFAIGYHRDLRSRRWKS